MNNEFIENNDLLENLGISIFPKDRNYWFVRTQGGKYYNTLIRIYRN